MTECRYGIQASMSGELTFVVAPAALPVADAESPTPGVAGSSSPFACTESMAASWPPPAPAPPLGAAGSAMRVGGGGSGALTATSTATATESPVVVSA